MNVLKPAVFLLFGLSLLLQMTGPRASFAADAQTRPPMTGLSETALNAAAERVGQIWGRQCFIVVKDGQRVYERYYSGGPETAVFAFSLTKSFATALIGKAVADGLLNPEDRLQDLGLRLPASVHPEARLKHVLAQVSESDPPGAAFRYDSGTVINLLSEALSRRLPEGQTPEDYARTALLAPLGMEHTRWETFAPGQLKMGYGIWTTARDAARLGQLFLEGGKLDNQPFLPAAYVQAALSPGYPDANGAHGYLWWLNTDTPHWIRPLMQGSGQLIPGAPEDLVMATGMTGNFIYVFPQQRMVVVSLGHTLGWQLESLPIAREVYAAFAELLN